MFRSPFGSCQFLGFFEPGECFSYESPLRMAYRPIAIAITFVRSLAPSFLNLSSVSEVGIATWSMFQGQLKVLQRSVENLKCKSEASARSGLNWLSQKQSAHPDFV